MTNYIHDVKWRKMGGGGGGGGGHSHCVSNHQLWYCLLNRLFRLRSKKTSKLRVTGLCAGNSPRPVNYPHKWPVTRKMFPFDDVIMQQNDWKRIWSCPEIMPLNRTRRLQNQPILKKGTQFFLCQVNNNHMVLHIKDECLAFDAFEEWMKVEWINEYTNEWMVGDLTPSS